MLYHDDTPLKQIAVVGHKALMLYYNVMITIIITMHVKNIWV